MLCRLCHVRMVCWMMTAGVRAPARLAQVRLWDAAAPASNQLNVWGHHTEFVVGLDFSLLSKGMLASTGWDEQVCPHPCLHGIVEGNC